MGARGRRVSCIAGPLRSQTTMSPGGTVLGIRRPLVSPYVAAERGYVDSVILGVRTRSHVAKALRMVWNKRPTVMPKTHGDIPL
jgi:propionyl-CoA carboxylase beta chain